MSLAVESYALAGCALPFPEARCCPLPPARAHPRRARLPTLGVALARCALGEADFPATGGVFLSTAYGSQTESIAFLENMVRLREATPKPRAFSSSVHNAIAGQIAIALGARGPNHTTVHGGVGLGFALFAARRQLERRPDAPVLVGALDENSAYVERGRAVCPGAERPAGEGGALFLCRAEAGPGPRIAELRLARPPELGPWLRTQAAELDLELLLLPERPQGLDLPARAYLPWTQDHPAAAACALAAGVGLLRGELPPAALELEAVPARLGVLARARFGDAALVVLEPDA